MLLVNSNHTALEIAHRAHQGQVDKQGEDYIKHPLSVAFMLLPFGDRAYMAGLLHDVVEDSDYSLEDLKNAGIPDSVVCAVELVSRPKDSDLTYLQWIGFLKNTSWDKEDLLTRAELSEAGIRDGVDVPLAVLVKLADNYHNSLSSRSQGLPEGMVKRYSRARNILEQGIPDTVLRILLRRM